MRQLAATLIITLLLLSSAYGATVTEIQSSTEDTWHNGSSTLASNAQVLSAAVTLTNPGHLRAWCTLSIPSTSVSVTANTAVVAWFRVSTDGGSTYPDGDASTTPTELPHMSFPLRAVSTAQKVLFRVKEMPVGFFKVLIRNDGTGATLNTTWTLKCKTDTLQVQ